MIQRQPGFVMIIKEPALSRIKNNQCPSCGKPKEKWNRRTDWRCCSVKCTNKFEGFCIIRSWTDLREKVFKRDNFRCVKCKKHPEDKIFLAGHNIDYINSLKKDNLFLRFEGKGNTRVAIMIHFSELIADHIEPIALGGDQWDINNIQTLCIKCDKIKTKQDAGKIAKQRRLEKTLSRGQTQLTAPPQNNGHLTRHKKDD